MAREETAGDRISLGGDLTLPRAGEIREQLERGFEERREIIGFEGVGDVDLSFLQLLGAALRSAAGRGLHLQVAAGEVPPAIAALVESAGLAYPLAGGGKDFWQSLAGKK